MTKYLKSASILTLPFVGRQYLKKCGLCQRKWQDWYMDWAKVDGCARMNYYCVGNPGSVFENCDSDSGSNKKNVDKILGYIAGAGCAVNCWWIRGTYYYKDGGYTKEWYHEFD